MLSGPDETPEMKAAVQAAVMNFSRLIETLSWTLIGEEDPWRPFLLGSRLNYSQKATAAARLTADRKFLASLS
jgi:hypothetical protein